MRMMALVLVILSAVPNPAWAWNMAGHRIIGSVAFGQLSREEQIRVVAMLRGHPRFQEDFLGAMPAFIRNGSALQRDEWLFQQASVWPDLLRPERPPERFAFHRPTWHYINLPHFLTPTARLEREGRIDHNVELNPPDGADLETQELNIVQVIRMARRVCPDSEADRAARAVWLAWLMHNVGDLHQPLHSTALFSSRLFRDGDAGGNFVRTEPQGNLHALWDRFPGTSTRFQDVRNRALSMKADGRLKQIGVEAEQQLDEGEWLRESHYLAVAAAYDPEVLMALREAELQGRNRAPEIELPEAYLKTSGMLAERRLVQAGHRLAAILREMVREEG